MNLTKAKIVILILATLPMTTYAGKNLPMSWNGVIGFDTTMIDNYARVKENTDVNEDDPGRLVPNQASGKRHRASYQSYIFRLNPVLIINDSVTFKAEISNGYGRGGFLGDHLTSKKSTTASATAPENGPFGNTLYHFTTSDSTNTLSLNQFHLELYSNLATYTIGRHSSHWALGAMMNNGEKAWDRLYNVRDGLSMKLKFGNFNIEPFYGKIARGDSITRSTNVEDYGFSFLYDNLESDFAIGLLMQKRSANTTATFISADTNNDGTPEYSLKSDTQLLDVYFRKSFGRFNFAVEIPLIDGNIGSIFDRYDAKGFIFETNYEFNESFELGANFGHVSGFAGTNNKFEALYLNPNYKIAHLMFNFNFNAVANSNLSLFDGSVHNAKYALIRTKYETEHWTLNASVIYAKANETAKSGRSSYNHERNKVFTAVADQSDDLGLEIDFDADYHWNSDVKIGVLAGYHFVGDYYTFINHATTTLKAENSFILQARTSVSF
ncbi:MAG: hypothetical protein H6622_03550 [Halobacteriovoraceae bacterium]|nr:hypothetical protein [Halobacteriovoraceae bacterium]